MPESNTWPAPRTIPLVWQEDGIDGYNYVLDEYPMGSPSWRWACGWSAHLTNALHDAGYYVTKRRGEAARNALRR